MSATWVEYSQLVDSWEEKVENGFSSFRDRWLARLRHESWEEKRAAFLWYTDKHCERCGLLQPEANLQLHHLHYYTLWYENNSDLELLCPPCHRLADQERAEQMIRNAPLTIEERIRAYMETANRFSGQPDWPVNYKQARDKVLALDAEGE